MGGDAFTVDDMLEVVSINKHWSILLTLCCI